MADLGRQGILTVRDGRIAGFNRDAALRKIDELVTGR